MWLSKLQEIHLLWLDELLIHENRETGDYSACQALTLAERKAQQTMQSSGTLIYLPWQFSTNCHEKKAGSGYRD